MLAFFRENPRAFLAAVIVHLALLAILVVSLDWTPTVSSKGQQQAPIQATVIDADKLNQEVRRQEALKQKQKQQEQERLKQLEKQAEEARQARQREEQRLAELKQKREAEAKRQLEFEARQREQARLRAQQKAEAEKKRQAEMKRKAEQARKEEAKRKAEAEKKRKEEQVRKAKAEAEKKRKADAEKKRKAELAAKRRAEEAAKRKAAEAALQASLAEEQSQLAAARVSKEVNRYMAYIREKVQHSWIRSPDSRSGLTCLVEVRLIPSGEVIDAKIIQSSGDTAFDRSVEAAVFKASPLPVPKDPQVMEKFRSFRFRFKPG